MSHILCSCHIVHPNPNTTTDWWSRVHRSKLKFIIFQSDNIWHWKPPCEPIFCVYQLLSLAHLWLVSSCKRWCIFQERLFVGQILPRVKYLHKRKYFVGQILPRWAQWGKPELQQQIDSGCDCDCAAHQSINPDCLYLMLHYITSIHFEFRLDLVLVCEFVSLY